MGQFDQNHNIGNLAFNYAATEGTTDYGLLYASFGDAGERMIHRNVGSL